MKNKFLILWMLSSVLLAACDEELTPYNVDTCWLGFDMENSADTLVYRTFIYSGPQAENGYRVDPVENDRQGGRL